MYAAQNIEQKTTDNLLYSSSVLVSLYVWRHARFGLSAQRNFIRVTVQIDVTS